MTNLDLTENYFHIDNKRILLITIKQVSQCEIFYPLGPNSNGHFSQCTEPLSTNGCTILRSRFPSPFVARFACLAFLAQSLVVLVRYWLTFQYQVFTFLRKKIPRYIYSVFTVKYLIQ